MQQDLLRGASLNRCTNDLNCCCNHCNSRFNANHASFAAPSADELNSLMFARAEEQVKLRASNLAKQFLSNLTEAERLNEKLSAQKVFLALKLHEMPFDLLLEGLKRMGDSESTRSYFRKLARMVHPDKNGHELAKSSFQKLTDATNAALNSFNKNGSFTA